MSEAEAEFLKHYERGQCVASTIIQIIKPSQLITDFGLGFRGRLSLLNMAWSLAEAEEQFRLAKIGDRITCVIMSIDLENKQVLLSVRPIVEPISNLTKWERIERGDVFPATIIEELSTNYLVKTKDLYGLISKSYVREHETQLKVRINSKFDHCDLLSLVPADLEIATDSTEGSKINEFSFIDKELQSFQNFKKSMLAVHASDEDFQRIQEGFETDSNIFSKEISTSYTLYIQFELNTATYDSILRHQAIAYFFDKTVYTPELEKALLEILSKEDYWFKINKRIDRNGNNGNKEITMFSLYNENISFYGEVKISKDKKEHHFSIIHFNFGRLNENSSVAKKQNARYGSFLFSNQLKILSPYDTIPLANSQGKFLDYALLKTDCFTIIEKLRENAGVILNQETRTMQIMDKFLEYQINLIENEPELVIPVNTFSRIPGPAGGTAIELPADVRDSLEIEEPTRVNVRTPGEGEDELIKRGEGILTLDEYSCSITFHREIDLNLLKGGFYLDKKTSTAHLQHQRDIIQDFIEKKIEISHIESALVRPDNVRTPTLPDLNFYNPQFNSADSALADNNQIKAVKKGVGNQNIFLIQGPPGTGKTTVIAEIIQQLVAKEEKVLVAGQNHVAVDNVMKKIAEVRHLNILRVGNTDKIDKDLVQFSIGNLVDAYKQEFFKFLQGQLQLSKKFFELRQTGAEHKQLLSTYKEEVDRLYAQYGKLKDLFKQRHYKLRQGLQQLNVEDIHEAILSLELWLETSKTEYEILLKPLIYNSLDVVFATCIGVKTDLEFKSAGIEFDTVIIDEAGKANIAETLVAIELGKKVILVGDQKQLPPYIDSSLIDENEESSFQRSKYGQAFATNEILDALKSSFFEFINTRIETGRFPQENKEMLNYQHRMHPNIGTLVSQSFYDGKVKMGSKTHSNRLNLPTPFDKEIVFFNTSTHPNPYEQNEGSSFKNDSEAKAVAEILESLLKFGVSPASIAIVAPYKLQVTNIQQHLHRSSPGIAGLIEIATLDSFQGKEYDIIIFSFTRSSRQKRVGFLDNARRLNVAFSRAKMKLVLVGNSKTLTDPRSHFDKLFNYTELFNKIVELSQTPAIGNFVNAAHYRSNKKASTRLTKRNKPRVDDEQRTIQTKLKKLMNWNANIAKIRKGQKLKGIIVHIQPYGYFIELECGLQGLLHNRWLDNGHELKIKDEILVTIEYIDHQNKQISLGIR